MIDLHLHGHLSTFGECIPLEVRDPREALHAVAVQVPGFREALRDGNWHLFRGPIDNEDLIDETSLDAALGNAREMHVVPEGHGAGGTFGKIVGALILGPQLAISALTGGGLFGGMTRQPKTSGYSEREQPDERPSFIFDGPVNTSTQGLPVPLIYGRMRVGSVVVSAGITAEDIPIDDDE